MQESGLQHISLVLLCKDCTDGSIFMAHNFYLLIWNIASYPRLCINTGEFRCLNVGKTWEVEKVSTNVTTDQILRLSPRRKSQSERERDFISRKLFSFILFRISLNLNLNLCSPFKCIAAATTTIERYRVTSCLKSKTIYFHFRALLGLHFDLLKVLGRVRKLRRNDSNRII